MSLNVPNGNSSELVQTGESNIFRGPKNIYCLQVATGQLNWFQNAKQLWWSDLSWLSLDLSVYSKATWLTYGSCTQQCLLLGPASVLLTNRFKTDPWLITGSNHSQEVQRWLSGIFQNHNWKNVNLSHTEFTSITPRSPWWPCVHSMEKTSLRSQVTSQGQVQMRDTECGSRNLKHPFFFPQYTFHVTI